MAATGNRRLKVAKYESVLERHPRDKEALTQLGMLHEGLEEYGKAIEYFERCLQVDNQDTDVLTSTGYCYLRTEDLAKALATYQRALYLLNNKATPRILYGLGVIYDRNEKWDTARSTFEQLLTAFPDFEAAAEVKLRLGSVCKLLGELDASCTWFEATLACPTCPPPFTAEDMCFELAQVLCMQGKFKEAEEVYARSERDREQRAEDGDVEYVSCNESEQWCTLGRNYSAIQEYRQAFNAYNAAISLEPQLWGLWRNMGDLYSTLNQQNDALDAYQRVTELNPGAAEVWYQMGVILEASKRLPQAINALERVLDIEPTNTDVRARLERLRAIAPKRPRREASVMGARMQATRHTRSGAPPPNSLHQAVADGNLARLRELLATGENSAAPNMFDWGGKTPLHWAALNGEAEMAALLLAHGSLPDSRDRLGRTPLQCAALCGSADCARVLIEAGADVALTSFVGWCALHFAAEGGNSAVITLLLANGANAAQCNDKDQTALTIAEGKRHVEAIAVLSAAQAEALKSSAESSAAPLALPAPPAALPTPPAVVPLPGTELTLRAPDDGVTGGAEHNANLRRARVDQGRLHEQCLQKDQQIAVLQKELRRLAVENTSVSEEVWKQLEETEREAATMRIDLDAARYKISDLENEMEAQRVTASAAQRDLQGETKRLQSLLEEVEHLSFDAKQFDQVNADMIVAANMDGDKLADADPKALKDLILSLQAKLYVARSEQGRHKKLCANKQAELDAAEMRWAERERQDEQQLNAVLSEKVEMRSQMEKLKLQNSFLEKQLARRISVIDEVKHQNEELQKEKMLAEVQTQDLVSEVKRLNDLHEETLEKMRLVTFEKHKAEEMLHTRTKRVEELEKNVGMLEEQKKELGLKVGNVDVKYEEMQVEYRKMHARLERHELMSELNLTKEQAALLTEVTKSLAEGQLAEVSGATGDVPGMSVVPAAKSSDKASSGNSGVMAWSDMDAALEAELRGQATAAQEALQLAHKRLALKHVKNEALIGQLAHQEKKLAVTQEEMKECQRKLEQAERRFGKRMDTKTKLVDDLKEELGEKDRRIGAALQEVERLNNVVFDKATEIEELSRVVEHKLQEQMYMNKYLAQRRKLAYAESEAPSADEIKAYARYLGLDPDGAADAKWMWIAEEAISCPLPPSWQGMQDDSGSPFFYNNATDKSQYAHPMDDYFRQLYENLKACGTRYGKVGEEELRTENLRMAEELAKKQQLIDKLTTM